MLNLAALLLWVRLLPAPEFATLTLATTAALLVNALAFDWLRQASARILPDPTSPDGISRDRLAAWIRTAAITLAVVVAALLFATLLGLAPPGLSPRWNIAIFALAISEAHLAAITLVARLAFSPRRYAAIMVGRSGLALQSLFPATASTWRDAARVGAVNARQSRHRFVHGRPLRNSAEREQISA
jgi:hypothetical protein